MVSRVRVLVAVFVLLGVGAILASGLVSGATAVASTTGGPSSPRTQAAPSDHVVLIGVPGLLWSDVTKSATPALWRLAGDGSAGSMSTRTVEAPTCPIGGWLTISAGNRAYVPGTGCGLPPAPTRAGDGAYFPDFDAVRQANSETHYSSRVGLLSDTLRSAGACTTAIGPGAAVAAAGADGRVDIYRESIAATSPADWSRCPLTIVAVDAIIRTYVDAGVDAEGTTLLTEAQRARAVQKADRAVAAALRALPADATALIAGISDTTDATHMHVAMATGPSPTGEPYQSTYLTSNSTRRPKIVQITDITPTLLRLLGLAIPQSAVGSPWRPGSDHGGAANATAAVVEDLHNIDRAALVMRSIVPPFFIALVVGQLALYGLAAAALHWRRERFARWSVLAWTRRIALGCGAVPVATLLANLVPWWRPEHAMLAVAGAVAVGTAAVVAVALGGPWRGYLLGPVTVVAGGTALVLAIDVMTGSWLQLSSLMGYSPIIGGRFYGFGNPPYALFATGSLLAIAGLAEWQRRWGRPRAAVGMVIALGTVAVAIDGWPAWGSDLGGVVALVPGLAVLGLLTAGRRITVGWLLLFSAAGFVVVAAIAYADYLRPQPERTHLGRFVGDVLAGNADTVVVRKLAAMVGTLGNFWLALLMPFAVLFVVFVLMRPARWGAGALQRVYERAPEFRAGLLAVLVTALIGMVVNDSGIAVPAVATMLAIPLALAASIRALELDEEYAVARGPTEKSESGNPATSA